MKRIEIKDPSVKLSLTDYQLLMISVGINQIMDYLEQIHKKDEMIKEIENEKN